MASDGTPTGFTEEPLSGAGWRAIGVNLNANCGGSCKNMQLFYKKWANHVSMNKKDHKSFMNLICLGAIPQKQKVFSRATKGVSEDFFKTRFGPMTEEQSKDMTWKEDRLVRALSRECHDYSDRATKFRAYSEANPSPTDLEIAMGGLHKDVQALAREV